VAAEVGRYKAEHSYARRAEYPEFKLSGLLRFSCGATCQQVVIEKSAGLWTHRAECLTTGYGEVRRCKYAGLRYDRQRQPAIVKRVTYLAYTGARQGLFGLLLDARKNGEAEQVLVEGLRINPNQPGFAMVLARLQVDRGDTAGAIDTLHRSAPSALNSPDYLAFHAALLQRQSRHPEAVDHYQAALRLAPGSGVWLMGLGISLQAVRRNADAQDAFRRAKASNSLNPELLAFVDQRLRQLQ